MTDEIYALDLDWDLISHLGIAESVEALRSEGVTSELIEDELASRVFDWQMKHLRELKKPATASVLEAEFSEIRIESPQTVIDDLIVRLRERYGRNQGREAVRKMAGKAIEDPVALGAEMLREGRRLTNLLTARGETVGSGDQLKLRESYDKMVLAGRGPTFGFDEVDNHFYGQRGLTFMIGPPKGYKSWFTINAVIENIMAGNFPYLYSLELPAIETDMRLRCMIANVPFWKYLKQKMMPEDWKKIQDASELLDQTGTYRVEKPPQGERNVVRLIERARDAGADCIFLDQLQYIENRRGIALGATNDTKDYFQVNDDLRNYSDEGPIWIVHQFNRSVMGADKMPDMQQVKGSSSVEETGTLAIGLWASPEMRKSNLVQVGTLASRNYGMPTWEARVELSAGCNLQIVGRVDE